MSVLGVGFLTVVSAVNTFLYKSTRVGKKHYDWSMRLFEGFCKYDCVTATRSTHDINTVINSSVVRINSLQHFRVFFFHVFNYIIII